VLFLRLIARKKALQKFLKSAAQFVLRSPRPLHEISVVVPSRRAGLFFQKALSEELKQVAIAPRVLSIEDLILEISGLQLDSQAALFFKLFEAYQSSIPEAEAFEEFNKWGRMLLQDFNEIDRHLVEANDIFAYLGDVKRIENWNLEPGESDALLDRYLALWPKLALVHKHFTQALLKEKLAYQGLAYRIFYQELEQQQGQLEKQFGHFYFFGFNALNKAEEKGFEFLFDIGLADFFWDVDEYYLKNPKHEAGLFLRQSKLFKKLEKSGKLHGIHQKLKEKERNINIIAVSGKNLQAYIANQEMGEIAVEEQSNTALVMADEELLKGILNNLHPGVKSFNLSMGLSLKNSPLAGFFELLLDFALEAERSNRKDSKGQPRFSHKKWNALLSHFVLRRFSAQQIRLFEACRSQLIQENALYRSLGELEIENALAPLPKELFVKHHEPHDYFGLLARFCLKFHENSPQDKYLNEALFGFYQVFNQLEALLKQYPYIQNFEQSLPFFRDLLGDLSMDLRGEPLSGLQVMGMLETRLLDFKRLIITSLNEGVLPKGKTENSLLPFDVKRKFGLPTYLEKDAVYAYHFYRLLHQAEDISLLYSTSDGSLGLAEASRFIKQLELEWPKYNRRLKIRTFNATGNSNTLARREDSVDKTPSLMKRLEEMAAKGFSPTALIQYLKDPVDFYYERVLGLKPEEQIQEDLELPLQGTALHQCLEKYYSEPNPEDPEQRQPRTPAAEDPIYHKSKQEYKEDLKLELKTLVPGADLDQGPNYLILETMSQMLYSFMWQESTLNAKKQDWKVLATEANLEGAIALKSGLEIKLKGQADRIDQQGDLFHIIDYKSGAKGSNDYNLSSRTFDSMSLEAFVKKPYAFQLPLYTYLFYKAQPQDAKVKASILSLRKAKSNPISMNLVDIRHFDSSNVEYFEAILKELMEEIFNPDIPFKRRDNEN